MDDQIRQIQKLLDSAEGNLHSARNLIRKYLGDNKPEKNTKEALENLNQPEDTVVEGIFNGTEMVGNDSKTYLVPPNYASKSKLVEGDVLKLSIVSDGSYVFKQIQPTERINTTGTLALNEDGSFVVNADGKSYKVLTASVTFYKAEAGDTVTIVIPKDHDASWAVLENVISKHSETVSSALVESSAPVSISSPEPVENKIIMGQTSVDSISNISTDNNSSSAVADEVKLSPPLEANIEEEKQAELIRTAVENINNTEPVTANETSSFDTSKPIIDSGTPISGQTTQTDIPPSEQPSLESTQDNEVVAPEASSLEETVSATAEVQVTPSQPAADLSPASTDNGSSFQIQYPGGQPTTDDELLAKLKENLANIKTPDTANTTPSPQNQPVDSVVPPVVSTTVAAETPVTSEPAQPQPARQDQPITELDI